jgi:hypothetical protein
MMKDWNEANENHEFNVLSERIHDMDPEYNEKIIHYLHAFLEGLVSNEKLLEIFNGIYKKDGPEYIKYPWE